MVLAALHLPWWVFFPLFTFWVLAFVLDVKITTSYNDFIKYETNPLFRFLARKFSIKKSVTLQVLMEIGLIIFMGCLLKLRFDLVSMSEISSVFGLAHLMAWHSNKRFLEKSHSV